MTDDMLQCQTREAGSGDISRLAFASLMRWAPKLARVLIFWPEYRGGKGETLGDSALISHLHVPRRIILQRWLSPPTSFFLCLKRLSLGGISATSNVCAGIKRHELLHGGQMGFMGPYAGKVRPCFVKAGSVFLAYLSTLPVPHLPRKVGV